MSVGTSGSQDNGGDQVTNDCGIAKMHAYSLLEAFEITEANSQSHKMIMIRNPWGSTYYTGDWNYQDSRWTDDVISQVPLGIDPKTSNG